MKTPDRPLSYWIAVARTGFEEDLARLMAKKGINKTDLARKIDTSPPFITKVLNGTNNYTLKTMAKLSRAIGAVLEVRLADEKGEVVRVLDIATARELELAKAWEALPSSSNAAVNNVTSLAARVAEDEAYETAKRAALERLERGTHLGGGPLPSRDELHDRAGLR